LPYDESINKPKGIYQHGKRFRAHINEMQKMQKENRAFKKYQQNWLIGLIDTYSLNFSYRWYLVSLYYYLQDP
jgi:hypothetical protein